MTTEKFSSILIKYAEDHDTVPFSGFEEAKEGGLNVDIEDEFVNLYNAAKSPTDTLDEDLASFITNMLTELANNPEI